MLRSRTHPEQPASPDAEADVLPEWLRSRDVSSVGQRNPLARLDPAPTRHALLTIHEVAKSMRVSIRTVSRWIASGELVCIRIGRVVRVPAEALDALMKSGKHV